MPTTPVLLLPIATLCLIAVLCFVSAVEIIPFIQQKRNCDLYLDQLNQCMTTTNKWQSETRPQKIHIGS